MRLLISFFLSTKEMMICLGIIIRKNKTCSFSNRFFQNARPCLTYYSHLSTRTHTSKTSTKTKLSRIWTYVCSLNNLLLRFHPEIERVKWINSRINDCTNVVTFILSLWFWLIETPKYQSQPLSNTKHRTNTRVLKSSDAVCSIWLYCMQQHKLPLSPNWLFILLSPALCK